MKKTFRKIHMYLSLFFLPLAIMYAVTGIIYISGSNQDVGATINKYVIIDKITAGQEKEAVYNYLKTNNIKLPNDKTSKSKKGNLVFGGAAYSAELEIKKTGEQTLTVKNRSFIGNLIMLHKSKGMWYFDVLSIAFGIALFILYFSGLMMTLFGSKNGRMPQYATIAAGFIITIILGYLSLQ